MNRFAVTEPSGCIPDELLRGKRIGVYTSVVGMGGSEILIADAIEAAFDAGAEIVCYSHPNAAIRDIIRRRYCGDMIEFRDWPEVAASDRKRFRTHETQKREVNLPVFGFKRALLSCIPRSFRRVAGYFKSSKGFAEKVANEEFDLFFANVNGFESVLAGIRSAMSCPVVGCYHLSVSPIPGGALWRLFDHYLKKRSMQSCDQIIHTSEAVRRQWDDLLKVDVPTRVIYNGVDFIDVTSTDRDSVGVRDEHYLFVVPARLDKIKGHRYLIEAVAECPSDFLETRILLCGDGEERANLESEVSLHGLDHIIKFLGWRSDIREIMKSSDCAVLSSIESENFSVAILEAATFGIPAVVTAVGGMSEMVIDKQTGFVVSPKSPQALSKAMLKMAKDRTESKEMGVNAKRLVSEKFTRERMKAEYVDVFQQLVSGNGNRA